MLRLAYIDDAQHLTVCKGSYLGNSEFVLSENLSLLSCDFSLLSQGAPLVAATDGPQWNSQPQTDHL